MLYRHPTTFAPPPPPLNPDNSAEPAAAWGASKLPQVPSAEDAGIRISELDKTIAALNLLSTGQHLVRQRIESLHAASGKEPVADLLTLTHVVAPGGKINDALAIEKLGTLFAIGEILARKPALVEKVVETLSGAEEAAESLVKALGEVYRYQPLFGVLLENLSRPDPSDIRFLRGALAPLFLLDERVERGKMSRLANSIKRGKSELRELKGGRLSLTEQRVIASIDRSQAAEALKIFDKPLPADLHPSLRAGFAVPTSNISTFIEGLLRTFKDKPQLKISDLKFLQESFKDNRLAAPKFRAHTYAALKSAGLDKDAAALQGSNALNPLCAIFTDAIPLIARGEDAQALAAYGVEIRNLMGRYSKAAHSAIGTIIDRKVEFLAKANEVAHLDPELQEILLADFQPGQRAKCLQNYLSVRGRIKDDAFEKIVNATVADQTGSLQSLLYAEKQIKQVLNIEWSMRGGTGELADAVALAMRALHVLDRIDEPETIARCLLRVFNSLDSGANAKRDPKFCADLKETITLQAYERLFTLNRAAFFKEFPALQSALDGQQAGNDVIANPAFRQAVLARF